VLEHLGEYVKALEHLQKAAILNRFEPPSDEHVKRLMEKAKASQSGQ
jgi:hypothetical protein